MRLLIKSGWVELDPDTIAALKVAFPTKDVDRELAGLHLWLIANPSRRPARLMAFLRNNLRRADDLIAPKAPQLAGWWASELRTVEMGARYGLSCRPGETWAAFRERIGAAIAAGRAA